MTTTRRNHLTASYDRSPFITERRRKLFPIDDHDMDSELGHISPLCSDSSSDSDNDDIESGKDVRRMTGCETPVSNRACSESMSPLILSPSFTKVINETPRKFSPSHNLKTPHDSSTKAVLQKEQKALLEESKSSKRKSSPGSSPERNKFPKTDNKSSKVRTALFPPETDVYASLSTKSFYSKTPENVPVKRIANRERYIPKPIKFSASKHGRRHTKKFGQINNGVSHKIRKPKQRKMSKAVIAKAAKKLLESSSVLNEYINDLAELKNKQKCESKLIQPPVPSKEAILEDPSLREFLNDLQTIPKPRKLISSPVKQVNNNLMEENKENVVVEPRSRSVSPLNAFGAPEAKSRKFFKSSRSKVVSKPQESSRETSTVEPVERTPRHDRQEVVQKIQLVSSNDFEDDDVEPNADIDNILSALSDGSPLKDDQLPLKNFNESQFPDLIAGTIQFGQNSEVRLNDNMNDSGYMADMAAAGDLHTVESSQVILNDVLTDDHCQKHAAVTRDNLFVLNRITLQAHDSILASENSIQLHREAVANAILSPISQMCDVTSGLAIDSPKKGRNPSAAVLTMSRAHKILSFTNCSSSDMEQQKKLFPVFCPGTVRTAPERGEKRERGQVKRSAKKFKALPEDQMLLDAGQKKFGYKLCNECNIVYHMGDPGDEIEHMNYHNANHILRFAGWKNEHVVADFQKNGRIIRVLPTDSKIWHRKVKDLMEFVKRELGCYEMEYDISDSQVYLYIKNRTIAGCAVATVPKENGHRMLSSVNNVAMCSEESYPIKCGISYIWVSAAFRKQGVATALLNAVKCNFTYGEFLTNNDIALTSPTEAGAAFAEKYFKTPNYLIYYT